MSSYRSFYQLEKPAGQIYCGTHTTLGLSNVMHSTLLRIEMKMGLDKSLSKFICSMELDSKNGSLAGQALDMMLKLVAPEYRHKAWNYYGLFTQYLGQRDIDLMLFSYKHHWVGCLSRPSAVLLSKPGFLKIRYDQCIQCCLLLS